MTVSSPIKRSNSSSKGSRSGKTSAKRARIEDEESSPTPSSSQNGGSPKKRDVNGSPKKRDVNGSPKKRDLTPWTKTRLNAFTCGVLICITSL